MRRSGQAPLFYTRGRGEGRGVGKGRERRHSSNTVPLVSDPQAEEAETELKASALLDAIRRPESTERERADPAAGPLPKEVGQGKRVLLIDHEDSFVHTLANYIRQTGAQVVTCRSGAPFRDFLRNQVDSGHGRPDLVVLSPGPGSPDDFHLKETIAELLTRRLPVFGVCLGLQALVEYYGGSLKVLGSPMHGKPSLITREEEEKEEESSGDDVLAGLPLQFEVARYHSLHGSGEDFPSALRVTAKSADGVVMALQHRTLPIAAVQFHPESILTLPKHGMQIISNALALLTSDRYPK